MRLKNIFTFSNFIKAVAKYPTFCNQKSPNNTSTLDDLCKIELATLFAHITQETGGHSPWDAKHGKPEYQQSFVHAYEIGCDKNPSACNGYNGACNRLPWSKQYPCGQGQYYFGRGPLQCSWSYNYGAFSYSAFGTVRKLLDNPELVATDGSIGFMSALWFFMTPQTPKPSMHEVLVGLWKPNSVDMQFGYQTGFGATISIINGAIECGRETNHASNRVKYFKEWLN